MSWKMPPIRALLKALQRRSSTNRAIKLGKKLNTAIVCLSCC